MTLVGDLHSKMVFGRRVRVLTKLLAGLVPADAKTLVDIGCGDGQIALGVGQRREGLQITGLDVLVRPKTWVPVNAFDGNTLPLSDQSVDVAMFVDVLHHTHDPMVLLREAKRVARQAILIKDHCKDGFLAGPTLRFMDWVGNAHHGVVLPYNYWSEQRWRAAFAELGLTIDAWTQQVPLYPRPASWLFQRRLHYVARLTVHPQGAKPHSEPATPSSISQA
jgi:SAM-dependent methyltransferase